MMKQRGKQKLPSQLGAPEADERTSKSSCTVNEVMVMDLQSVKKPTLILPGDKNKKGLRSPSFHRSAPNLSESKLTKAEVTGHAEKVTKDDPTFSQTFYASESQSMENLAPKRPVKLAPLDIPLEVKEAQLQKIMSFQREAQLAAFKLAGIGSSHSEPHMKRVKNLAQLEAGHATKAKTGDKAISENQDGICTLNVAKPLNEIQIILPTERTFRPTKKSTAECSSMEYCKPQISKNLIQEGINDFQEDVKIPGSPAQGSGRRRFKLKQMKEQECPGKTKPEEGKLRPTGQRALKTLNHASKLIDNVAKKHRGQNEESIEVDEGLLGIRQTSRRMALGDIIQVDEE